MSRKGPVFLKRHEEFIPHSQGSDWSCPYNIDGIRIGWGEDGVTHIRLPSDHEYYRKRQAKVEDVLPPDWAIERARELIGMQFVDDLDRIKDCPNEHPSSLAFARYIAQHEDPPIDPLVEALRETYGGAPEFVDAFRKALANRGLEIREIEQ